MFKRAGILALAMGIFLSGPCFAEEDAEELVLQVSEVRAIPANFPSRVAVSNPLVLEVSRTAEREVVLTPKAPGKTTVVIWDKRGQRAFPIRVISEDLKDAKLRIDKLLSELGYTDVYSKISAEENKVMLLGSVNDEKEKEKLDGVLVSLKEKIMDMIETNLYNNLVQIDVQILEVSKNALDELGFQWSSTATWTEQTPPINKVYELFDLSKTWERSALDYTLNLLVSQGKGRVLSRPKLVCLSGKEASFIVGGEVPVLTLTTTSGTTGYTTEYKDYGISLTVTPTVKSEHFIQAVLKTEVSDLDWGNAITASGIKVPAFSKRSAETELYLREDQTILLAGLIKSDDSKNLSRLPALGDIPIIGMLFRSKSFESGETELVISLTPRIIRQTSAGDFAKEKLSALNQTIPKTLLNYIRDIQERITKAVIYPEIARRNNAGGEILLSLHILADGRLLNVVVNKSSGNRVLDEMSVNTVKAQAPFAPLPLASGLNEIWIDVPITFKNN